MKHFVRRYLFKGELQYLFLKHNIEEALQGRVSEALFLNPNSPPHQIILKDELNKIEDIEAQLQACGIGQAFSAEIRDFFLVTDDLSLPQELRQILIQNEGLAIFVGAGVSKLMGYPLWEELAAAAIERLYEKAIINNFEKMRILGEIANPKQKLDIFRKLAHPSVVREFFLEQFRSPKTTTGLNPYDILARFDSYRLSTNADGEYLGSLNKAAASPALPSQAEGGTAEGTATSVSTSKMCRSIDTGFRDGMLLEKNIVYQIHGSVNEPEKLVMTTQDYLKAYYGDEKKGLPEFLSGVFGRHRVLFIGYGLEEFEVLGPLVAKAKTAKECRHFILLPVFQAEVHIFGLKKKYFEELGIMAIPYYLDVRGYERLIDVLQYWADDLNAAKNKDFYEKAKAIDDVTL